MRRAVKPSTHRPFRGPTPLHVFQTIDLGSGDANYSLAQAKKFKHRKYGAIDPVLKYTPKRGEYWRLVLANAGVKAYGEPMEKVLPRLVKMGFKTRHLNMHMPSDIIPGERPMKYEDSLDRFTKRLSILFEAMPKLLLPNGKLYVTTEGKDFIHFFEEAARKNGFSFRQLNDLPMPNNQRTDSKYYQTLHKMTRNAKSSALQEWYDNFPIHRIEITYPLKKAMPNKEERRKWGKAA